MCAGGEGEGMRVSHSHTTGLLPTTPGWWLRGEEGVSRSQAVRVAAPPLPPPFPLLCCIVCWCQHATCCSHPATPPPHQSWHRGLTAPPLLSSPLSVTAHIPSAAAAAGGRRPDIHPHVMMMMTRRCVPLCAPHEVLMHGEHSGHCTCCNLAEQRCVWVCVCDAMHCVAA